MPTMLIVGGDWGIIPKKSGYIDKLIAGLDKALPGWFICHLNGAGDFDLLQNTVLKMVPAFDVVLWAPNVSNSEEKIIEQIKKLNPTCILVETKRNPALTTKAYGYKYAAQDLVAHALKNHANLLLELLVDDVSKKVTAGILDPLGNRILPYTADVQVVAAYLAYRIRQLKNFTRMRSVLCEGSNRHLVYTDKDVPAFLEYVKKVAVTFHELVHGANTERFLGNYSFRCLAGFPAMRSNGRIFVSPRNLDKREITLEDFVEVEIKDNVLCYYGYKHKPSVDAPIQVKLFELYPHIDFMLHSHVYIKGAPMTEHLIPCGAMEEVYDISKTLNHCSGLGFLTVNLRGHGSLIMANRQALSNLSLVEYEARPIPELM